MPNSIRQRLRYKSERKLGGVVQTIRPDSMLNRFPNHPDESVPISSMNPEEARQLNAGLVAGEGAARPRSAVDPPDDTAEGGIRGLLSLRLAGGLRWRETLETYPGVARNDSNALHAQTPLPFRGTVNTSARGKGGCLGSLQGGRVQWRARGGRVQWRVQ
jgi:hypothetical protein